MWAHNNPAPQRCHKKSRGGCKACKLRKVKCDEKKQICGKCVVHFSNITACDYGPAPKAKPNAKRIPIPDVTAPSQDLNELEPENNHTAAPGARNVSQASNESSAPLSSLSYRIPRGFERLLSEDAEERRTYRDCTCSYHQPEYTYMMLDAILGICRICGNQPRPGKSIYECCPVLSDAMLLTGRVDLFSILPAKSSPRVHALMHHFYQEDCGADRQSKLDRRARRSRDPYEGLRQMMTLRGGIQHYTLNSVFLHMLCLINHLIAVINENPTIIPRSGIPRKPKTQPHSAFTTNFPSSPSSLTSSSSSATRSPVETSPFLKDFATSIGFHSTVVDLLHEIEYLYFVVDAFTTKFMPEFREGFEDVVRSIETIVKLESEREKEWVLRRLKRWGEGYACSEDV